jgi:2-oxo-4-hydroxy-4-carboxy-5-ureidoimidazoline decarboxylase
MTLQDLNTLTLPQLRETLFNCCGSTSWVNKMLAFFPVEDLVELLEDAEEQWYACNENDWREAFAHHPKIGDVESLQKKFAATAQWASSEQAGVNNAASKTIEALALGNQQYEQKFGYIFIVCATGKSAEEMLGLLQARLLNDPATEIKIAMEEQNRITKLRIEKLLA